MDTSTKGFHDRDFLRLASDRPSMPHGLINFVRGCIEGNGSKSGDTFPCSSMTRMDYVRHIQSIVGEYDRTEYETIASSKRVRQGWTPIVTVIYRGFSLGVFEMKSLSKSNAICIKYQQYVCVAAIDALGSENIDAETVKAMVDAVLDLNGTCPCYMKVGTLNTDVCISVIELCVSMYKLKGGKEFDAKPSEDAKSLRIHDISSSECIGFFQNIGGYICFCHLASQKTVPVNEIPGRPLFSSIPGLRPFVLGCLDGETNTIEKTFHVPHLSCSEVLECAVHAVMGENMPSQYHCARDASSGSVGVFIDNDLQGTFRISVCMDSHPGVCRVIGWIVGYDQNMRHEIGEVPGLYAFVCRTMDKKDGMESSMDFHSPQLAGTEMLQKIADCISRRGGVYQKNVDYSCVYVVRGKLMQGVYAVCHKVDTFGVLIGWTVSFHETREFLERLKNGC